MAVSKARVLWRLRYAVTFGLAISALAWAAAPASSTTTGILAAGPGSPYTTENEHPTSLALRDFYYLGTRYTYIVTNGVSPGGQYEFQSDGTGGFTSPGGSPFDGGGQGNAIASGDFNGDGIPDIAIAGDTPDIVGNFDTIDILLADSSGNLTYKTQFISCQNVDSIAVGDYNGDSNEDLAITCAGFNENEIELYFGNGSGNFTFHAKVPVGTTPVSIVAGGFNEGQLQELAVGNSGSNDVSLLVNDGSGNFAQASNSPIAIGRSVGAIAVAIFTGSGHQDLAIANPSNNTLTLLLGDGKGRFTAASGSPFTVGSDPSAVAAGDFNGDGHVDLAVANQSSNSVTVLLGDGNGGFAPASGSPFGVGTQPDALVAFDFDGDGADDLAVANHGSQNMTVLLHVKDTQPPTTSIALSPGSPNGQNGWYVSSVHVKVSATDTNSGVAETRCVLNPSAAAQSFDDLPTSCPYSGAGADVGSDGSYTVYAASKDHAGNKETPVSASFEIDSTPPSLAPTVTPSVVLLNGSATAVPNATDATSGLASAGCPPVDTSTAGDHTLTCTATDNAGNSSSATVHYTVAYNILGFFSPAPSSKWKKGTTVPIKVALADANGTRIGDNEAQSLAAACRVAFAAGGAQTAAGCMKYDAASGQFVFSWKIAGAGTGPTTISATVDYPGTTVTTVLSQSITVTG